jgi:hypothetical protein
MTARDAFDTRRAAPTDETACPTSSAISGRPAGGGWLTRMLDCCNETRLRTFCLPPEYKEDQTWDFRRPLARRLPGSTDAA